MTPEQLMQVWAATYAAEYVRRDPRELPSSRAEACAITANLAIAALDGMGLKSTFEGYEKL